MEQIRQTNFDHPNPKTPGAVKRCMARWRGAFAKGCWQVALAKALDPQARIKGKRRVNPKAVVQIGPFNVANTIAVSSTDRQIGLTLSRLAQKAMAPARDIRPKVGRSPVVPHRWLGEVIERSVSVLMAKAQSPPAVA